MEPELIRFVEFLDRNRIRATYKAVGEAAEVPVRSVGVRLGERCPLASWVVNEATGEPTGYADHQEHRELRSNPEIISSAEELLRRMKREVR